MFSFAYKNARWLLAGALLSLTSSFGQTFFFAIFTGKILDYYDLTPGEWGRIYMIGTLSSAALMLWAGSLADRFRTRILGPAVFVLLAMSCVAMAINSYVFLLPFLVFVLRFSGQGMATHLSNVSMTRWFAANRGKALSIGNLGYALGEAFLPMLFVTLMAVFYWKNLWFLAAAAALLSAPLLFWLLRAERTPQSTAQDTVSLGMGAKHWARRDVLRHWLFWLMIPALLGPSAFNTAFMLLLPYFAEIKGVALINVVALFPIQTGVSIVFVFITGMLLDRVGAYRIMPFFLIPICIGFLMFSVAQSLPVIAIGFLFMGITAGANATLSSAFWAEFYGTRHIGAIKSIATAVMVFASAIGPGILGYLIDYGVPFEAQLLGVSLFFIVATLFMVIGIFFAKRSLPLTA